MEYGVDSAGGSGEPTGGRLLRGIGARQVGAPVQAGRAADRAEPGRGRRPRDGLQARLRFITVPRLLRSAAWAGGRELACRRKPGSYASRMVGPAMSRRAGLGSVATGLVLVLTAAVGCASPGRHT